MSNALTVFHKTRHSLVAELRHFQLFVEVTIVLKAPAADFQFHNQFLIAFSVQQRGCVVIKFYGVASVFVF